LNVTSAEWPSAEISPFSESYGLLTLTTLSVALSSATTPSTTARNCGSSAAADSFWTSTVSLARSGNAAASA
jgi:hypothetical protein